MCELITGSQYQRECVEVTKESERAPILKMRKFLLWGWDIKHTWARISLSVARVFEFMPERMTVRISARVRGRRDWTAWGKHGKEVVLELGSPRGQDLDWERRTGHTCLAGGHLKGHYGCRRSMAFGISARINEWVGS